MTAKSVKVLFRCCVKDCDAFYAKDRQNNESFFRLPDPERITTPHLCRLARMRLVAWNKYFSKKLFTLPKNRRICGRHFVSGQPAKLTDTKGVDWIPSLYLSNNATTVTTEALKDVSSTEPVDDSTVTSIAPLDTVYVDDGQFSSFNTEISSIDPIKNDDQLSRFCRLCLRDLPNLLPITSPFEDVFISDMLLAVAGISLHDQNEFPEKLCDGCLVNLQTAYGIRKQFVEADSILREMAQNENVPLVVSLREYQENDYDKTKAVVAEPSSEEQTQQKDGSRDTGDEETFEFESQQSISISTKEAVKKFKRIVRKSILFQNNLKRKKRRYDMKMQESKVDPNKCYICSTVFSDPESLSVHMPSHVQMIPYNCDLCVKYNGPNKVMKSLVLLHRHFRMHAGPIECPKCPVKFYTVTRLHNHIQRYHSKHAGEEYICAICGNKVLGRKDYMFHLRSHKALQEGRFTCRFCDKKFTLKVRLVRHELGHTDEKPFKCKYCEKCFTVQSSRYSHERTHTGEKGYRCEFCGSSYRTVSGRRQHQQTMHANMPGVPPRALKSRFFLRQPVKCSVEGCSYVTNIRARHYRHKNSHEMKHHCEHCSERFPTKEKLRQHTTKHTGTKPYCCDLCGRGFKCRLGLSEHMDHHTGIRPYKCEVCGMGFVRERHLKSHNVTHSEEKNYECSLCDKSYKYQQSLGKHERSYHTRAVPKLGLDDCVDDTMDSIEKDIGCLFEDDCE
ncbi:zinc finger protein 62 homolog [Sabethes cyaneus]|uniref:zinc finger protein 62 homolog n=1 Tax=Sabethes cyaneus TaxID=53552 RepID=UPI00237E8FDB|nr:zinc finger protein 62 homolog [Sabethes cyaneus]